MNHDPRLPRDDVNVSPRHPLKDGAIMLMGLVLIVAIFFAVAVVAVEWLVPHVPVSWETRMFPDLDMMRHLPETPEQHAQEKKLQGLFARLVARWPESPPELRVGLLDAETPNALAFPGGLVLVTTGLMNEVESENELAFVLGHELGHFRHRDHLRSLGRGVALALILAALGQSGAVGDLVGTSTDLSTRSFSRAQESEADAFGLGLVEQEFGHVQGATSFFERLPRPGRVIAKTVATYFATHPLTDARIAEMNELAEENGWRQQGETMPIEY